MPLNNLLFFLVLTVFILPVFTLAADPANANPLQEMLCRAKTVIVNSGLVIIIISWIIVGILFLASVGSTERLSGARKALFWAIIGTAVYSLATISITIINSALGTAGGELNCP